MGLLTVREASERLRCSSSSIYAAVARKKLACLRIGLGRGHLRIDEADLEKYVRTRRQEAEEEPTPPPPVTPLKYLKVD